MVAIGHFALGATASHVIMATLPRCPHIRRFRMFISMISGLWAMLPDIAMVIPWKWLERLEYHWTADIFWAHRFLDVTVDPTDNRFLLVAGLIGAMIASGMVLEILMWYRLKGKG